MTETSVQVSLLGRYWTLVRGTFIAIGGLLVVVGLAVNPWVAARFFSDDGILQRGTFIAILAGDVLLFGLGLLAITTAFRSRTLTSRTAYWLKGACVLSISIVMLSIAGECAVRLAYRNRPVHRQRHYFFLHDSQLGWRHRPGAECLFKNQPVRINAHGLREEEFSTHKPPGVRRILMLGDSQLFGDGISAEAALAKSLERQLANVQVINAGVIGYGTDQELLYFERDGERLSPDLTIVTLNPYDFRDNISSTVRSGYRKPRFSVSDGRLVLQGVPVPPPRLRDRLRRWLSDTSMLYWVIQQRVQSAPPAKESARNVAQSDDAFVTEQIYPQGEALDRAGEVTCHILAQMADSARRIKSRFLVVFLPYEMNFQQPSDFTATTDRTLSRVAAYGKAHDFEVLDMRNALRDSQRAELYIDTMHFSAAGNARLAASLAEYLHTHQLLPAKSLESRDRQAAATVAVLQPSHKP